MIPLAIGLVLAFLAFKASADAGAAWYWAIVVALVPLAFALFLGIIGVVVGAIFVAGVWKVGN